jgi:hypothetical protein
MILLIENKKYQASVFFKKNGTEFLVRPHLDALIMQPAASIPLQHDDLHRSASCHIYSVGDAFGI